MHAKSNLPKRFYLAENLQPRSVSSLNSQYFAPWLLGCFIEQ